MQSMNKTILSGIIAHSNIMLPVIGVKFLLGFSLIFMSHRILSIMVGVFKM